LAGVVVQTQIGSSYTHEDSWEEVVIVMVDCRLYILAEIRRARSGAAYSNVEYSDLPESNFGMIAPICSGRHRYCI